MALLTPLLAVLMAAAPPPTTSVQQRLATAKVCYDAADFECAERELAEVRKGLDSLDRSDRVTALDLSAVTAFSQDKAGEAEAHIKALLTLAPNFEPKAWKADWVKVLVRVRGSMPDRTPPVLNVKTPPGPREREPVTFVVMTRDPSGVDRVRLGVKTAEGPRFFAGETKDRKVWTLTVPPDLVTAGELAVWIEAWDIHGNRAEWSRLQKPTVLTVNPSLVPKPQVIVSTPVYETWWFWTIVGVGVAGIATAIGVSMAPQSGSQVIRPVLPEPVR